MSLYFMFRALAMPSSGQIRYDKQAIAKLNITIHHISRYTNLPFAIKLRSESNLGPTILL